MKWSLAFIAGVLLISCSEPQQEEVSSIDPVNWSGRKVALNDTASMEFGTTYLSVYSQIYSMTQHGTHDLTGTVSLRNVSPTDSVYILKAQYYNTAGKAIRTYLEHPIFLAPLETVEIVIDERDRSGGTGANFTFDWAVQKGTAAPLFEAVMISTSGQQGLSFTTTGVQIK